MKKNFVKYFGVASTTLLAVAPVATPALMTASNLQVVKAGVQDDITAHFKEDNTLVTLTADQWKALTSTVVSEKPDGPVTEQSASQEYLDDLKTKAVKARTLTANSVAEDIVTNALNGLTRPLTYEQLTDTAVKTAVEASTASVYTVNKGDGKNKATAVQADPDASPIIPAITTLKKWIPNFNSSAKVDKDEKPFSFENMFPQTMTGVNEVDDDVLYDDEIKAVAQRYINSLPLWWFVSDTERAIGFNPVIEANAQFNTKSSIFTPIKGEEESGNGLVTVAPNGGTEDTGPEDPDLAYVGDNLVDLQKRTGSELVNLVPATNQGKNKSGVPFKETKGKFQVSGGTVTTSRSVKEGSKVWDIILKSVLNPQDAMYPLKDAVGSNMIRTKMLVNGKDATKNQFITKDEIQSADRVSIQFIFKANDGNEYKSPTIWLTHGNKFTVNTSGLANITRLPGDYYLPSTGITGILNDTGLPMDPNKFVVVPAGTDLAYYTDSEGKVNLSELASLQGGILGSDGVAINRNFATALEGGELSSSQYRTNPNYFYSKFGTYNDAVDIYYIDGKPVGGDKGLSQVTKSQVEYRNDAAGKANSAITGELARVSDPSNDLVPVDNVWNVVYNAIKSSLTENVSLEQIKNTTVTPNIASAPIKLGDMYSTSKTATNLINSGNFGGFEGSFAVAIETAIKELPVNLFKKDVTTTPGSALKIASNQFTKVVANAGRTTKVDVPSKYLPKISFNNYKGTTYYDNGATIDNWFNYSWNSGSSEASNKNPYYPSGGVIVTGGSSAASSAAKQPVSYLAPAAFAANSITADQLNARVTDNIQKFLTAKLSNPNTQSDSNINGYFKAYKGKVSGDAAYAYIKNGAVPASDLKIDTSKVDVTKAGTYYAEVTYTPLRTIKSNTFDGYLGATNGNVAITDANGNVFSKGGLTDTKFNEFSNDGATAASSSSTSAALSNSLTTFAADQIFANGAPATYKLKVQITDGSTDPQSGAPVIAFTEGGQNLKIAKGGTFDQFKGLQFYAYPGAKAWDQKDDSVKVDVSGKVNTNVEGTYTLVYTVTNKAGKTSTLTRVITVGDGVEKPTEYDFNLSQAYIDYVPGYNVREYSYPGDEWAGKQVKHGTSVSVTRRAVFQNGEEWYKLGDGNWVKKQYVKVGQNPNESVDARGVVTVNYVPGYGIAVYKEPGKSALVQVNGKPKRLAHGTSWKSFKKQTVNNVTYYNVGGNQWVNGNFVNFK